MNRNEKYKIIYADFPWQYKVYSNKDLDRSAENHFSTIWDNEVVCDINVNDYFENKMR